MPKRMRYDDYLAAAMRKSKSPRLKAAGMAYPYVKMAAPYVKKGVKRVFRKAKRPTKRRPPSGRPPARGKYAAKPGNMPRYKVGRYLGNFKKGPRPPVGRRAERHIDTSVTVDQPMVNYVGFQTYGSCNDILYTYCMALCREWAERSQMQLVSWNTRVHDQNYTSNSTGGGIDVHHKGKLSYIGLLFSKTDVHGNRHQKIDGITLIGADDAYTWADLAAWLRNKLLTICANEGFSPEAYSLCDFVDFTTIRNDPPPGAAREEFVDTKIPYYTNKQWGEDIVTFACKSITKVNNVTPAGTDRHDINDVNANPLQGKLYDFTHQTPRFRDAWLENTHDTATESYSDIDKLQSCNLRQDMLQTQYLRLKVPVTGTDDFTFTALHKAFKQPPRGSTIFKNCDGVKDVHMPPGGFKSIVRTGTVKASTARFIHGCLQGHVPVAGMVIEGVNNAAESVLGDKEDKRIKTKPVVTPSFMLALEPTVRTATNEEVKLVVNRDLHHMCWIRKARSPGTAKYNTVRATTAWPHDYEEYPNVIYDAN